MTRMILKTHKYSRGKKLIPWFRDSIDSTWFHVIPCDSSDSVWFQWFHVIPCDSIDSMWFHVIPSDSTGSGITMNIIVFVDYYAGTSIRTLQNHERIEFWRLPINLMNRENSWLIIIRISESSTRDVFSILLNLKQNHIISHFMAIKSDIGTISNRPMRFVSLFYRGQSKDHES